MFPWSPGCAQDLGGLPSRLAPVATFAPTAPFGRDVIELPGGHVGYVTHPAAFARELVQALARTGHGKA